MFHRNERFVDSKNINCKNGQKKIDFDFEGIMRDCEIKMYVKNSRISASHLFSIFLISL